MSSLSDQNTLYTPIVQDGFSYDIVHNQLYETFISGGGSITVNDGIASISITNADGDSTLLRNKQVIKYRIGYTTIVRFSVKFDTPVANSLQLCGLGTSTNEIYLGYNGNDLVSHISKGGSHDIRTLTITVAPTGNETFTLTLDDTIYNGTVSSTDLSFSTHEIKIANTYTGYTIQQIENTLIFLTDEIGVVTGTFSFTSTGSCAGSFSQDKIGSVLTTTNVTSNNWNGNASAIRRLNPETWNMYEIEYGWYGVSNVVFRVFNEYTNVYDVLHTSTFIDAPNTALGLNNPSMYIQRFVKSLGSTTAITMDVASVFAGMIGIIHGLLRPRYSIDNIENAVADVETVILYLSHRMSLNGILSTEEISIRYLSIATNGANSVLIKIYKNPTSIGTDILTDYDNCRSIDSSSITLYGIDAQTYTGGILIEEIELASTGQLNVKYDHKELFLQRGEYMVITATSSAISTVHAAVGISEDL